ncbi:MAG: hypothetical protein M9920_13390 [Verrucomicrobiae bacterium]|nr:hypothetical protein [Verrucomicrobiae bacterium]
MKKLTPLELELGLLDAILWLVEGFKCGRIAESITIRLLRAAVRRIQAPVVARSKSAEPGMSEYDHAIPVAVICKHILNRANNENLNRDILQKIIADWHIRVELTKQEHRKTLKNCGLTSKMPADWNGTDRFARYKDAGIQVLEIAEISLAP